MSVTLLDHIQILYEKAKKKKKSLTTKTLYIIAMPLDWLQSLKQFFINVPYHNTCSQSNSDGSV